MEISMGQGVKRTQRDYSLRFKLSLVEQIEKVNSPTSRHNSNMAFRAIRPFWYLIAHGPSGF